MTTLCLEYLWIGGNNELRSKTKVETFNYGSKISLKNIPIWNFDGSSTNLAETEDSEILLLPVGLYVDPLRINGYLVLCETYYSSDKKPTKTNNRHQAFKLFQKKLDEKPWYGIEQEYFIIDPKTNKPLGLPDEKKNKDACQGQYYCSVGAENAFGREIVEEHLQACISCGLKISGVNAEVAPGQWEFQIGPAVGIEAGDHMCVARYLLIKIAEKRGMSINFEPKPVKGKWNGSGCHTNYSTVAMRNGTKEHDGLYYIDQAIEKLSKKHDEHMKVYGEGNDQRMSGSYETSCYDVFSDGIADRGCSIRRGNMTVDQKKGYFEDRRPSSNCDPYLVTSKIFETTVLLE